MFVVEKNNDIKFTFDDRSVLLQKKIHRYLALATAPVIELGLCCSLATARHKPAAYRRPRTIKKSLFPAKFREETKVF